jgi:hypothetical protein
VVAPAPERPILDLLDLVLRGLSGGGDRRRHGHRGAGGARAGQQIL